MNDTSNIAGVLLAARGIDKQASALGDFLSDNAGAIIGGLAGLGGGSVLGSRLLDDSKLDEETRRKLKTRGGILGGLTGAIAGGLGGHLLHGKLGGGVEVPVQSTVAQAVGSNETGTEAAAEESYTPEEVASFIDMVSRGARAPIEVVDRNRVRQAMRYLDPNADEDTVNTRNNSFRVLENVSAPFQRMGIDMTHGPVGKALESALLEGMGMRKKSHFNKQASSIGDFLSDNAGAIIGGLAGLGGGALAGVGLMDEDDLSEEARYNNKLKGGIIGGLTGALAGGLGGHFLHHGYFDGGAAQPGSAAPNDGKKKSDTAADKVNADAAAEAVAEAVQNGDSESILLHPASTTLMAATPAAYILGKDFNNWAPKTVTRGPKGVFVPNGRKIQWGRLLENLKKPVVWGPEAAQGLIQVGRYLMH